MVNSQGNQKVITRQRQKYLEKICISLWDLNIIGSLINFGKGPGFSSMKERYKIVDLMTFQVCVIDVI